MTYQEKCLERKMLQIAKACNVSAVSGLLTAALGLTFAAFDLLANAPLSGLAIVLSVTGCAVCLSSSLIGSIINKS